MSPSLLLLCLWLANGATSRATNVTSAMGQSNVAFATSLNTQCNKAGCSCSKDEEGQWSAICTSQKSTFPSGLPAELSSLNIHCNSHRDGIGRPIFDVNHINRIPKNALGGLPNLTEVVITGCPISEFPAMLFANLTKLRRLSLESLLLVRLAGSLFWNAYNLESLQIINMADLKFIDPVLLYSQSRLSTITLKRMNISGEVVARMIQPLSHTLKYFTWSQNLHSVTLPLNIFKGFALLKRVDLRNNKLEDLNFLMKTQTQSLVLERNSKLATSPPFNFGRCKLLRNLIELDLRSTNLRHMGLEYAVFRQLRYLYLGNNHLTQVPSVIYTHLNRTLVRLDLSNNNIQVFPKAMEVLFKRMNFELIIERNPLHCNCEAVWLLRYPTFLRDLRCASVNAKRASRRDQLFMTFRPIDLLCTSPSKPTIVGKYDVQTSNNFYGIRVSAYGTKAVDDSILKYSVGNPITIGRGQSLTLRCDSTGDPAPVLFWLFPWGATLKRLPETDRTLYKNIIEAQILHDHLKGFTDFNFTCRATNIEGTRQASVALRNLHPIEVDKETDPRSRVVTAQPSKRGPGGSAQPLPRLSELPCLLLALWLCFLLADAV